MPYWGLFVGKLAAIGAVAWGILIGLMTFWPREQAVFYSGPPRFAADFGFTMAVGAWFLVVCGLLYLAVWDQRYRCRVCVRRLRMPIETGSWSRMLQLGRPRIEYICTYGHGKLNVEEVQILGVESPEWTPQQGDLWEELCASGKGDGSPHSDH
ncbi:MAG: hypothetical protein WD696_18705 [Bryobacteraceae bacterium]